MVSDEDVYSWAVHFVDECGKLEVKQEAVKVEKKGPTMRYTEEDNEKFKEDENPIKPVAKIVKPVIKKTVEQMSLFDIS